jgi:transcriptional antiterminator NusG
MADKSSEKLWYVVHTYSGYENKVEANLIRRIESMDMKDKIFQVLVPVEKEIELKNGKQKEILRKIYPGYVMVEMFMTDDSWFVVRNTPGVTGFVGSSGAGSKPTPLHKEEVNKILEKMNLAKPKPVIEYRVRERVKIIEGPLANFIGIVEEVQADKKKLKVLVDLFGRDTRAELDYSQVDKE